MCGCIGEVLEDAVVLKESTLSCCLDGEDVGSSEVGRDGTVAVVVTAAGRCHSQCSRSVADEALETRVALWRWLSSCCRSWQRCKARWGRGDVVEGEEAVVSLTGSLRAVDDPLGVEAEVMTARDVGVALMDTPR